MKRLGFAASLLTLLLAGCLTPTGNQKPADVVKYGAKIGAGSTGIHTVLGGDTVYTVAKQYNLPLRDIIAVNDLAPPYKLRRGFRLKLPPPNEYQVQAGDTLNGVSRMFGTSVSEVARQNNLSTPFVLKRGQVLRLPSAQPKLQEEFAANTAPPSFESVPLKVAAVESEVLAPPPGQASVTAEPLGASALPTAPKTASAAIPEPHTLTPAAGFPPQPAPHGAVEAGSTAQLQTASVIPPSIAPKVPARMGNGRFMQPVDGKIISPFGPKPDGLHNDGINIRAAKGTPVRAADNGVVAYTGSGMSGYGNLVLIRHQDRWMTAYAHLGKTLVKKGDTVKAGQSIGTVGNTGGVDSPQLHFEVRKGTEAVDPVKYL